jgi:hypothetical protein
MAIADSVTVPRPWRSALSSDGKVAAEQPDRARIRAHQA